MVRVVNGPVFCRVAEVEREGRWRYF